MDKMITELHQVTGVVMEKYIFIVSLFDEKFDRLNLICWSWLNSFYNSS